MNIAQSHNLAFQKTIIGLFTALFFVSIAGCKINLGSDGGGTNNSTPYTKVDTQTIGETTYDIVTFGTFPQSKKTDDTISVDETDSKTVGSFTYYKGSDGEWYAKRWSKYYKVEPIKWRVLTANYDHDGNASTPGKKLLLAENILIYKAYHESWANYENSSIRAYLTGDFLTTAFTQAEQDAIAATTVINNARSTNPDGDSNATLWDNGVNWNASDTPISDKIFLLSEQEVTKADYGFAAYNEYKGDGAHDDSTRIRLTTDFASGAGYATTTGYGDDWWLRSPYCDDSACAHYVDYAGGAWDIYCVYYDWVGVVPALCLN